MHIRKFWRVGFSGILVFNLLASLLLPAAALAADRSVSPMLPATSASKVEEPMKQAPATSDLGQSLPDFQVKQVADEPQAPDITTLSVTIISTPRATLDHNGPELPDTPHVYVIEAMVINTGTEIAKNVVVTLDYNENPLANWVLLENEDTERTIDSLAPGEENAFYVYWFASYSSVVGAYHLYTVTASADNADPISTSENFYAPAPDRTVTTQTALSTGNSGITQVSADIIVGVAFTIDVDYNLGTSPSQLIFSPVGNTDFNPGAYRLISTEVRFYNTTGTLETVRNRLYFPTVNSLATKAEVKYTFLALTASNTRLCSYAVVKSGTNNKYDQFYCDEKSGTIIPIEGTISLSLAKQANTTVLQSQSLAYTIQYTNTGTVDLTNTWIWDDVITTTNIITPTISPAADPIETTEARVAWDLGIIPAYGSGTLSFSTLVDGNGQDLPDGTPIVNHAFFGINPGSLPSQSALTSIVTTTVHAPTVAITKTDGKISVEPDEESIYTLTITNTGSVEATGIIITDTLPAGVSLSGEPSLTPYTQNGQTLVWHYPGTLAATNGSLTITIPVKVGIRTPNGTVLSNQARVEYQNTAGHKYQVKTATDTTTVNGPILTISKTDSPDPVLTGNLLTYKIIYANTGPSEATNVVITDTVPTNTTYDPDSCSGGNSCSENGGVVTWILGTVSASGQVNSSGEVIFSVLVKTELETGTVITNGTFGIVSAQTNYLAGVGITTTVNREAAIFEGYTFEDINGNGKRDPGEDGIPGVTVTLPEATNSPQSTNSSGFYRFRVEQSVPITITAEEVDGYFRTTPGTIPAQSTLGITQTVNFGYAPNDSEFGVVFGLVFEDDNRNGALSSGELGIPGVTVASTQAVTPTMTTDNFGVYTFRFNVAVETSVTVNETNLTGYVSTTPDNVQTQVRTASSGSSPVNFGDFLGIKITGQVFDDTNVNGAKDIGELGLPGAIVTANDDSFVTDATGVYTLYSTLPGGAIDIIETDPADYISTDAVPGTGMLRLNANTLRISTPVSGQIYSDGDFGDVASTGVVTIQGFVWNDNGSGASLANGLREAGEPGLAGAEVSLSTGLSQITGLDGAFLLYAPPGETITITEKNPTGYTSTNAIPGSGASKWDNNTLVLAPQAEETVSSGHLFGDVQTTSVAVLQGKVFDDLNENGMPDAGEPGLPDVLLTLEINLNNNIAVYTDANGQYQFAVAPGTDVRITSSGPGGIYYPTTVESLVVHPPAPGTFAGIDFGYSNDIETSVIYGIVFDDRDSDGVQDFGESGLVGAIVTLGDVSVQTSSDGLVIGTFTFPITPTVPNSIYHVVEVNPSGYRSTTPDNLFISATPGQSYFVDFGDTNTALYGSIYGTTFEDLDLDGVQDVNEVGLPGVVISFTVGGYPYVITTTTKLYGQFTYGFDVQEAGYHTIGEQDPAKPGYRSTTPDFVNVYVQLGNSYTVNFGDAPDTFAVILGSVFNDASGDGIQDPSEVGIPGVTVTANGTTKGTDAFGRYSITVPNINLPRTMEISEQDLTGYHSTTPNIVPINVQPSKTYQVDFGDSNDASVASIYGIVFSDLDVDGQYDLEPGLAGITVTLQNNLTAQFLTNQWGQYTFQVVATGNYTITETDPGGYVSTNAIPGSLAVTKIDNNTLVAQMSSLGTSLGDNRFGDVLRSSVVAISGLVWNDNGAGGGTAGDGQQNGSEPGLAGATVALENGMTQITGASGEFILYSPPNQAAILKETNPSGYLSTNAIAGTNASRGDKDTIYIIGLPGNSSSINNKFGDVGTSQFAVITGRVFDDQNENGLLDTGEPGFSGRTVTLAIVGTGELAIQTDASGDYLFAVPPGTEVRITSSSPGTSYYSTTPPSLYLHPLTVGLYDNNHFGYSNDSDSSVIYGTVFRDDNQNTEWDLDEPTIPGVNITLDGSATKTTGASGNYTFRVTSAGNHTLVEADPGGYQSTTPNQVTTVVAMGQGYLVNFGDLPLCTISPDIYEEDDTSTLASVILTGIGNKQSHNFADDSTDWVKFTAEAGMVYTITTSASGLRADTYLELFDIDGQTLLKANDDFEGTTNFSSRLVWKADKSGVYYIKVTNRDNLSFCLTEYDLWIIAKGTPITKLYLPFIPKGSQTSAPVLKAPASPLGVMSHAYPDAYEVDDTWMQAKPIFPAVGQVHSFDSNPVLFLADKDWVFVDLRFMDVITFTTQPITNTQTLLELYDENGYALNVTGINQLTWDVVEGGRYYLSVSPDPLSPLSMNFGPSIDVGYVLNMYIKPVRLIFLPFTVK